MIEWLKVQDETKRRDYTQIAEKTGMSGFMDKALENPDLYQTIVNHRQKFNKVAGVDYNLHAPQQINPIPPDDVIDDWRSDYNTMIEHMIYEKNPCSFDEIIADLTKLKAKINALPWQLHFQFPNINSNLNKQD